MFALQICIVTLFCLGRINADTPRCKANEVYLSDGRDLNCNNWQHPPPAPDGCQPGCYCKDGYVRDASGNCIAKEQCPKTCGQNEVYEQSRSNCRTCSHPDQTCPRQSGHPGCYCKLGYVLNEDTKKCVKLSSCPKPAPSESSSSSSDSSSSSSDSSSSSSDSSSSSSESSSSSSESSSSSSESSSSSSESSSSSSESSSSESSSSSDSSSSSSHSSSSSSSDHDDDDDDDSSYDCAAPPKKCGKNASYVDCACQGSCGALVIYCFACIPGCQCDKGYTSLHGSADHCVKICDCPETPHPH